MVALELYYICTCLFTHKFCVYIFMMTILQTYRIWQEGRLFYRQGIENTLFTCISELCIFSKLLFKLCDTENASVLLLSKLPQTIHVLYIMCDKLIPKVIVVQ